VLPSWKLVETEIERADGDAGARTAAATLAIALCAETTHSTLSEDWAKVDLKIGVRSALQSSSQLTIHCQVKSGKSFRADSTTAKTITLQNIDEATISSLQEGTQPALLVWVPPPPSIRVYWRIIKPKGAQRKPIRIARENYVTPSLRFDLSRYSAYLKSNSGFPRIELPTRNPEEPLLQQARGHYKQLKSEPVYLPLVGKVEVTRLGWRHITRGSRSSTKRERSLRMIPYLRHILGYMPTRYLTANKSITKYGSEFHESRHLIFWYKDALIVDGVACTALVRIREDFLYPTRWNRFRLGVNDVTQKSTILGWWYKPTKKQRPSKI
jgi:hypothetical protein